MVAPTPRPVARRSALRTSRPGRRGERPASQAGAPARARSLAPVPCPSLAPICAGSSLGAADRLAERQASRPRALAQHLQRRHVLRLTLLGTPTLHHERDSGGSPMANQVPDPPT